MKYSIYFRSDRRYEGRISKGKSKDGKRIFKYFFGYSREEVEKKIDEYKKMTFIECSINVEMLFSEWLSIIRFKVKESTYANYLMKIKKHIFPEFSEKTINTISESDIYNFIKKKQKTGLSNRYISDIIILMKSVFKYAEKKYNAQNPIYDIVLPKPKTPEIKLLDESQQKKLQQYITKNQNNTTLGIALSMSTGIRIGELCALKWEDIDIEKRILTVNKTIQRVQSKSYKAKTKVIITEPKSESSKRKVPIPECIVEMLEKFKSTDDKYVVSGTKKPTEPRTLQYRFVKILKNANLPSVHFHSLRHIFATKCVKLGFDIKSLSEILGHSNIKITLNRYVHSDLLYKIEYMKRLDMIFS